MKISKPLWIVLRIVTPIVLIVLVCRVLLIALPLALPGANEFPLTLSFRSSPDIPSANQPITSAERLIALDELYGARHTVSTFNSGLQLRGNYTRYAYKTVPAPLKSVVVFMEGDSLVAVQYTFDQIASSDQTNAALVSNGTGWKDVSNKICLVIKMTYFGDYVSSEGHWLNRSAPILTVYFDSRWQSQLAQQDGEQKALQKVPAM